MAKIIINPVQAGNGLETAINLRFQQIEDALNDDVLWRDGFVGEPNQMEVDFDCALNDILNVKDIDSETLTVAGVDITAQVTGSADSAAAALVSETNAAASEAAASLSEANAAASEVSADADATTAAADAVSTAADAVSTAADAVATAADAVSTASDATDTGVDAAATAADAISTAADAVSTAADVTYAEEWAVKPEDSLISVAAGGDGVSDYSALHWAAKAAADAGVSPLTTKGDLYTYDTANQRLAIGADTFVLTADSAEATGMKWAAAGGGGGVLTEVVGQNLIYGGDGCMDGINEAFATGSVLIGKDVFTYPTGSVAISLSTMVGWGVAIDVNTALQGVTAVGNYAAAGHPTNRNGIGAFASCFGVESGYSSRGLESVHIGYKSGRGANSGYTGDYNVSLGSRAMANPSGTGVANNTAVGHQALQGVYTGSTDNVAVGYQAAINLGGSSVDNVVVGTGAANKIYQGTANICIGPNAGPASGSHSNELFIDNVETNTPLIHADFSTEDVTITGDLTVTGSVNAINTLIIDIGDWDMYGGSVGSYNKEVTHGLTRSKIRSVTGVVRNDNDNIHIPLQYYPSTGAPTSIEGWIQQITDTQVLLRCKLSGFYDNTSYNATSFNRGWLVITYVD